MLASAKVCDHSSNCGVQRRDVILNKQIHRCGFALMASNAPPTYSEAAPQPTNGNLPPAYNESTRVLDVCQDGFNTQTQVRGELPNASNLVSELIRRPDDGRLDIRINETDAVLAKQIEQIRIDAQQRQEQQEQHQDQEAETPASPITTYASATSADVPPPLNIVIHVVGSRGDVQPFVALGIELKTKYNHRVRLATHGTFKKFVEENGLEFFNIGGDPAELMAFMVKNPGLIPGMDSLKAGDVGKRRKGMAEILQGCWKSCADADEAGEGEEGAPRVKPFIANAIIANPPSFAHIHCAEKLGIPLHLMFT